MGPPADELLPPPWAGVPGMPAGRFLRGAMGAADGRVGCRSPRMFLAGKPQSREMRFLQGTLRSPPAGTKAGLYRPQPRRRIEGFAACNPCGGRTWVMETCRQRPDAVRGTTAFIMHQAMRQFQGRRRAPRFALPAAGSALPPAASRRQRDGPLGPGDRHGPILPGLRNGRGLSLQESLPAALRESLSYVPGRG